jgi:hypothetical protein
VDYMTPDVVEVGEAHELIEDLGHKNTDVIPDSADVPSCGDYEIDE